MDKKTTYIYPGTFCPPHYGHVAVAREAAAVFGEITVICSVNPVKTEKLLFSPEECRQMWLTYDLGPDIEVATLDEFLKNANSLKMVMVRGIRDNNDVKYEDAVMLYNCKNFAIKHYHYIICEEKFRSFSSTRARAAAKSGDMDTLELLVNKEVAHRMRDKLD